MTQQEQFINKIAPLAQQDMKRTKVLSSVTIAQAILESGWGVKSNAAIHANNFFGMTKGSWEGEVYTSPSGTEYRKYNNMEESVKDHGDTLMKKRYKLRGEKDYKRACQKLQDNGYCDEEDYASQLINIIERYKLFRYDI